MYFVFKKKTTTNLSNLTNLVQDFYKDFSLDFERSDPSKTPPSSEAIERILVGILVKDFYYDNPK